MEKIWSGFYKKNREERLNVIKNANLLDESHLELIEKNVVLDYETANNMVENVVGTFSLPFSVVPDFVVDDKTYLVPLVTEEPSVVAACNNAGKIVATSGGFKTTIHDRKMIGHVALYDIKDAENAEKIILENKALLLATANEAYPSIVKRGGGACDIDVKILSENETTFVVVYLVVDTLEAMGANMLNTMLEAIKVSLETLTGGISLMAILSNYATSSLITTKCEIPFDKLTSKDNGEDLAKRIELASKFAKIDVYRAATHNKGIFNGIDSIVIASGNDWRAVEAACQSYAAKNGRYEGLSTWTCNFENKTLIGELTLPMPVASVGGSIGINPSVKLARHLLKNPNAKTLASIIVSVGLAQNLAALRALVGEGIQKGHMKLHAKSLAILAGATNDILDEVVDKLRKEKHMNLATAKKIVEEILD
ncbi:hydroxymethylglutaryl-CoA reductase, degradative [Gemella cuniculi]|uniref:hydroxymethylglutaryl-CoA reductase, degradative n=1 Tax=Gemella cuniculi TaxID=150240 RepID=UPI00040500D7|nr:hydroxymethylglutaryl-CoA reductase, degradative [Gemella cuniculi]